MDEILKQVSKEICKTYCDDWMTDDTCSYALRYRADDHVHYQLNDVCHARAYPNRMYRAGVIRSVTTSIWRYDDDSKEFVDWMLDKERSPWRGLFGNMTIHRDGDTIKAVTIDDLDKTDVGSDYVLNFLIATRIHSEKDTQFDTWKKARAAGLNEAESLIVATHLWEDNGALYLHTNNSGHFPFDAINMEDWASMYSMMNSVERLEKANPNKNGGMWRKSSSPTPINGCWREKVRKPVKYFNQLSQAAKAPVYQGSFAKHGVRVKTDLVVPKGREEEIKLTWDDVVKSKHEWRV